MSGTAEPATEPPRLTGVRGALKQMFTGADNSTLDLGRILWAHMAVGYLVITGYHAVVSSGPLDPIAWGGGAAAVLAGGGGSLALKAGTEPKK